MKKNIWIWNHYATDMYRSKGGRHYWFAENLILKGYNVTIFCANTFHNREESINTNKKKFTTDTSNGIPFVFVKTTTALGNGLDRVKNMMQFYMNLYPVAKTYSNENEKPDIIIASSVHPLTLLAGIQTAKKMNIPCICEIRDLWPEAIFSFNKAKEKSLLGRILIKGEHWIYKHANALIFTKEGDIDYIKEKKWDINQGGDIDLSKSFYINNGVDIEAFNKSIINDVVKDADLESRKFNVVYVGAIRPVNNVVKLVETASELKDFKDIQFLIYGDGNQRKYIENKIEELSLTNIKIKGSVEKKFIPYILSKSSVNILNYSQKHYNWSRGNSSNKLFEYMASGKPIISTVKMGYSILEKYNCGIEIEDASGEEIAREIIRFKNMTNEEYKAIGDNGITGAKDFDFKNLTDQLIQVIERTMEGYRND